MACKLEIRRDHKNSQLLKIASDIFRYWSTYVADLEDYYRKSHSHYLSTRVENKQLVFVLKQFIFVKQFNFVICFCYRIVDHQHYAITKATLYVAPG